MLTDSEVREFYYRAYHTTWLRENDYGPKRRFTKMWYKAFVRHVAKNLEWRDKNVLEVGAGYGYLAPFLCSYGAKYVGTEIVKSALEQFPKIATCSAVLADGRQLPFVDSSFDYVICMEVIEHLQDPVPLIQECLRVCAGTLIVSCPSYLNGFGPIKFLANLGLSSARRYLNHQIVDRTTSSLQLRRLLSPRCNIVLQRAVRLAPPFVERLDWLAHGRVNDCWFWIEDRLGHLPPFNYCGLHTLCAATKLSDV